MIKDKVMLTLLTCFRCMNLKGFLTQKPCLMARVLAVIFIFSFPFTDARASSNTLNYQGRILRADGTGLDYNDVSFIFQILNTSQTCIIYEEQVDHFDMSGTNGIFDVTIGDGRKRFPLGGVFKISDAFTNSGNVNCSGGGTFSPVSGDGRLLRVSFYDGMSWETITPDNLIRSVPYATNAITAEKLGAYTSADFLLKVGLPTCGDGTFLTWNGSTLTCAAVSGAAGGTVTEISSSNPYINISNGTTNPVLTLNVGNTPGTVAAGNDSRITGALQSGSGAGGALIGTFPNPLLAINSVASHNIQDGAITSSKVLTNNPGINRLVATDGVTGETLSAFTCSANEILIWDVAVGWRCTSITGLTAGNANYAQSANSANNANFATTANFANTAEVSNRFSGELIGDVTGTQGATVVSKIGGFAVDLSVAPSGDQVLTWNGSNWVAASLPSTSHFLTNTLAPGKIILGNATGAAVPVSISGDATLSEYGLLTLTASGVSAGSYKSVTVDSKGRIISGTNPTTLSGFGITDAVHNKGGVGTMSAGLDAEKPQSPSVGDLFVATDSQKIFRFNGSSWDLVSSAGGSGGTVTSISAGEGLTGGTIIGSGVIGLGPELSGLNSLTNTGFIKRNGAGLFTGISQINLQTEVSGTLPQSNGGTGFNSFADGQLLIGNSLNNGLSRSTLTSGTGISIENGNGTIRISNTGLTSNSSFVGDISGTLTTISVDQIKGKSVSAPTSANQMMIYNGSAWVNRIVSGDASISSTGVLALSSSGVASGTYKSVSVDSKGRVIAGSNPQTLSEYGITDAISNLGGNLSGNLSFQSDTGLVFKTPGSANTVTLKGPLTSADSSIVLRWPASQSTGTQALVNDGTGNLSWESLNQGSVKEVTGTGPIVISGTTSNPTITVSEASTNTLGVVTLATNGGTNENTVVRANDSRLSDSRTPAGVAEGDLSGTYPNPVVSKIQGTRVSGVAPSGLGQVMRFDGVNWAPNYVSVFDLKSSISGNQMMPDNCTSGQTLIWTAATDKFTCTDISITSAQVSNLAASASIDTTNASNITSGILNSARLPVASGVADGVVNQLAQDFAGPKTFLNNISTLGNLNVSGTLTAPTLRLTGGAPASGKILVSDQNGNASWQLLSSSASVIALTDAASIVVDASLGNVFQVTLAGNRTISNPMNLVNGQVYTFRIIQDATGNRGLTWGNKFLFTGNSFPATAANALTVATFVSDGNYLYNIGGYNLSGVVPFSFTSAMGLGVSTLATSNTITLAGVSGSILASVSGSGSPQLSVNGGAWTSSASVSSGDTLAVRATASSSVSTTTTVAISIGNYVSNWNITTTTNPSAYNIAAVSDILNSSLATSAANTPTGYTGALPITVSGSGSPQISINGGGWVSSGTISPTQNFTVRLTGAATDLTALTATVTIGTLSTTWTVTTGSKLYDFTTYTFNNCGQTGYTGPTLGQCQSTYSGTTWASNTNFFNMSTQGIQKWTVPRTGVYRITAVGAAGGSYNYAGGYGASMRGDFNLNRGDVLQILVGQKAADNGGAHGNENGGGGGTFVILGATGTNALIVAGGGGGAPASSYGTSCARSQSTGHAVTGTTAATISCYSTTSGASGGNGGNINGSCNQGSAGGGLIGNGGNGGGHCEISVGGRSFANGGLGGTINSCYGGSPQGGFGGGGAGALGSPGAGGGYSGGTVDGCWSSYSTYGGGGSSYNAGTNQSNVGGNNAGNGYVTITQGPF